MNAQLVTIVIVNAAFLFGAIEIFAAHFTGRLFRPLALAAAVLWMYTVNQTVPASAMVSLWMPHVALLAFLFFAAACASVAAGKIAHLPLMVLGAMVMVHLHVAQILFAGTMSLAACVSLAVRRTPLAGHWKTIAASLGIVALFLLPVALELAVDHPNNLDDIRAYLARYPDPHLGMAIAVRYYLSFLAFLPDSTVVMGGGPSLPAGCFRRRTLRSTGGSIWLRCAAAVASRKAPRFVWVVAGECLLVSALFLVWANRITGDLYGFNGFFIYGIQLLGLWSIAGTLAARWKVPERWARAAWIVPFAAMTAMAGEFRNPDLGNDAIRRMSEELRPVGAVHLVFRHDDWDTAVGIANQMARGGQAFCVDSGWYYMFGRRYVCRPGAAGFAQRVVTRTAILQPGRRALPLPAVDRRGRCHCTAGGLLRLRALDHCWTRRRAVLGFTLAEGAPQFRLTITGSVLPERPVKVTLNGEPIGELGGLWKSSASFVVPGGVMRAGEPNRLTFECPNAGPISGDARELGFSLMAVEIGAR